MYIAFGELASPFDKQKDLAFDWIKHDQSPLVRVYAGLMFMGLGLGFGGALGTYKYGMQLVSEVKKENELLRRTQTLQH